VLLIDQQLTDAVEMANQLRVAIASEHFGGVRVTASFGISASSLDAGSASELLNQADQALYDAKRSGRNRAVRWDRMTTHGASESKLQQQVAPPARETDESPISFQTVTALLSALAYRDAATAEHSRRVADYCVSVAHGLMSLSECYTLENAALLHDIGKIGVPDSILLKPGSLDEEEWEVIRTHDRISVEIIRSTFACDELTQIVTCHHTHFSAHDGEESTGAKAPLGARILAIADAYDAMTTDRVYRRAISQDDAFVELRRCAGQQFDPELVERFIEIVGKATRSRQAELQHVNKRTALLLGIQLENMARALDQRDTAALANLARQVRETATNCRIAEIAELANVLEESATNDDEWINNVQLTIDLMDLCRLTQRSHLSTKEQADVPRLPKVNRPAASAVAS
jgi:response regulator RpfG family c-di-GMP phosphodiesterase